MITRPLSRALLAAALCLSAGSGLAQAQPKASGENVYTREPLSAGRAQHARAVLAVYGPAIAFHDRVGAEPKKRLTRSDLGELFASVAFSSLGCSSGDSACEAKARQAGARSADKVSRSGNIGEAIQQELQEAYPMGR